MPFVTCRAHSRRPRCAVLPASSRQQGVDTTLALALSRLLSGVTMQDVALHLASTRIHHMR
jgi:hypothetical protein